MSRAPQSFKAEVDGDTPLRLCEALEIAFPRGGVNVSALRREAQRGRLFISRIAGKDFTTLNHVREMIEQCRVKPSRPDCGSSPNSATKTVESLTLPSGLSLTQVASTQVMADSCTKSR
jgi:hypothetical protein